MLVFDDGHFSDLSTLAISDWFAHTPKEVLSANFGVPESAFHSIPSEQVYIYQGEVPGSLESQEVQSPKGEVPLTFKYELLKQNRLRLLVGAFELSTLRIFLFQNNRGGAR